MQPKAKGLITAFQHELLQLFFSLPDSRHFFLTGGTALSEYYLGHRNSFDLDLFSGEKALILPFSRAIEEEFKGSCRVTVNRRFETFVEFEMEGEETVKVQLAFDSPFRFHPPELLAEDKIRINDFQDLAVDKLLAFFGRSEPRDAVDLHFLLKQFDWQDLLLWATKKDPGFDLYWLAVALSRVQDFPDDIGRWPVEMLMETDATEIKREFAWLSREIMKELKPGK